MSGDADEADDTGGIDPMTDRPTYAPRGLWNVRSLMRAVDAPVAALTIVGLFLVVLGILVGGGIALVSLGVGSLIAGGFFGAIASRQA